MKIAITSCPPADADRIAQALVEERLAACVNAFPVRSVYTWKNAVQREDEVTLLMKTSADHVERLRTRLRELHPYDLPEFVVLDVDLTSSLAEYVAWVNESTGSTAG